MRTSDYRMRLKQFIYIIGMLFISIPSFSQTTKQQQLEEQRRRLKAQIEEVKSLLADNKLKQRSVLDEVETLNSQINTRQNLIKITNQQTNLLTREMNANLKKIESYRKELQLLKEDYAKMVVKSYRSKSQQSKIMFLLSSTNFTQAYKRLQYIKQYNEHRKEQADQIQSRTEKLQTLNKNLSQRKKDKERLVEENRITQERLAKEKEQQQVLIASIRKKEGTYKKEIKKAQ